MSKKAKDLCRRVDPSIQSQAETLADSIYALQKKIQQQIPVFKDEELSIATMKGDGSEVVRANPKVSEFRALVRDYSNALKALEDILEDHSLPAETTSLDQFRSGLRIAK